LVEVIGMIKGLSLLMHRMEHHLSAGIRHHIYHLVQRFVQVSIRDSIRKAVKGKKLQTKTILLAIRDVCIDWLDGKERNDDPALRGEKDPKSGFHLEVPRRCIGLSSTQLYMMRTMLESLLSEKAVSGRKALRADLKESNIPEFEAFHRNSFFFSHLLKFSGTLRECCDLSQLWFREFFLELTMGERIQFPIEMSLPWILTVHILQNKEAHMMEYILYPLDLYSDSAHYALHHFKKQFLFDEVEAEVNLCFDQLVYKLSEQIFQYYKHLAASSLLDKKFRSLCQPQKFPYPSPNRYVTILKQRHVQLLGRSIDLNALLGQRLQTNMLKAISLAISKFEASDLCSIVELQMLLDINKLTHQMLSEHVCLDSWTAMFNEANQSVSSPHGRITLHIFWELHYDFLPNFCYNSTTDRFIRGKVSFADQSEREAPPKGSGVVHLLYGSKQLRDALSSIASLYESFVGPLHFHAMSHLLGYQGIAMILEQLLHIVEGQVQNPLKPYVQALMQGMPQKCKMPLYEYGSKGVLGFYQAQLAPVVTYRDLQTDVFQSFKEVGNTILFCLQLEKALGQEEVMDLLQAAPFQNMYPRPFVKEDQSAETVMQHMDQLYAPLHLVSMVSKHGTHQQLANARDSDLLTKERLCRALSMFEVVLSRMRDILMKDRDLWMGPPPINGVMNVDECQEFYRLWSAIQFAYCIPAAAGHITIEEWCGEGLQWAGCTIMALLGQQKRFDAFDFCYHMMRVHNVDRQDAEIQQGASSLKKMVERIRVYKALNDQIFCVLNKHISTSDTFQRPVMEFQPPIYQA
jgi:cytoplasmic FMR1 interacting protein